MASNVYGLRLLRQSGVQLAILGLLSVVVLAFRALQFAAFTREIQWGYDFSFYWRAAGRLLNGESIYSAAQLAGPYAPQGQDGFLYPPPLAAAVTPLTALFPGDYRAAAWIWAAIGLAIVIWAVLALVRVERLEERYPVLAGRGRLLLVAGALAFPPLVGELVLGNVHLLLLGLLTVAWLGVRRSSPGGEGIAGVAVGVAAVIKIFPGLLVLWFLLTRRYRAAGAAVAGAIVVAAIALPVTGIQPWLDYPVVLANLSAPSDTTDTLAPTAWLADSFGFTVARVVVTSAALLVLAVVSMRVHAGAPQPRDSALARRFGAAVVLSLLISPAMYHHYLAITVLPLLLGLGAGVPLRWLALSYFLMWGGDQPAFGDLAWVVNRALPTAGSLVLLVALALPERQQTRSEPHLSAAPA